MDKGWRPKAALGCLLRPRVLLGLCLDFLSRKEHESKPRPAKLSYLDPSKGVKGNLGCSWASTSWVPFDTCHSGDSQLKSKSPGASYKASLFL